MSSLTDFLYSLSESSKEVSGQVICVDLVPPRDIKLSSQLDIYVRPREQIILDKWPTSTLHLIDTYEIVGKDPSEIELQIRGLLGVERADMIGTVYHLITPYTKELHDNLVNEAKRRRSDAGKPFNK